MADWLNQAEFPGSVPSMDVGKWTHHEIFAPVPEVAV